MLTRSPNPQAGTASSKMHRAPVFDRPFASNRRSARKGWIMFHDLRFGARMLLKHKGFTIVAVLTLALGIGANTAVFSLINAALLRHLPVTNPNELVVLSPLRQASPALISFPMFRDLRLVRTSSRDHVRERRRDANQVIDTRCW